MEVIKQYKGIKTTSSMIKQLHYYHIWCLEPFFLSFMNKRHAILIMFLRYDLPNGL